MKKILFILAFFIPCISSVVTAQYTNVQLKEAFDKTMINNEYSFAYRKADSLKKRDSNNFKLKRHTLFFELGGTCIYYSIKYDLILKQWKKFSINYDIGFSILPVDNYRKINSYRDLRLPMQLTGLYGKNNSKLEFGVSIIFISSGPTEDDKLYSDLNETEYGYDTGINIGYRYQKKQGGLFFKAFVISFLLDDIFGYGSYFNSYILDSNLPWIGIGIGHTFR